MFVAGWHVKRHRLKLLTDCKLITPSSLSDREDTGWCGKFGDLTIRVVTWLSVVGISSHAANEKPAAKKLHDLSTLQF